MTFRLSIWTFWTRICIHLFAAVISILKMACLIFFSSDRWSSHCSRKILRLITNIFKYNRSSCCRFGRTAPVLISLLRLLVYSKRTFKVSNAERWDSNYVNKFFVTINILNTKEGRVINFEVLNRDLYSILRYGH